MSSDMGEGSDEREGVGDGQPRRGESKTFRPSGLVLGDEVGFGVASSPRLAPWATRCRPSGA